MATAKTTAKPARARPIGTMADDIWDLREKKRALDAQVKELEGQIEERSAELLERMKAEGMDKFTSAHASFSASSSVVANVEDWDAFWAYIYKNKYGHLLQRRVSDPAYRELLDAKKKVPGVQPFIKERLNIRALSS